MDEKGPRERLLADVVAYAAREGLTEHSLRAIAGGVGTTHRMLLYHFGSREGLVAAVVGAVEEQQRILMDELAGRVQEPAELMRDLWTAVSDPAALPFVALFFEAVAQAAMGRPGTDGFLAGVTESWLERAVADAERLGVASDAVDLRIGVAVARGLLIDALSGEAGRAAATEAMERFIKRFLPPGGPNSV